MYKILSVDDEPINQVIVEELFSSKFEVTLAASGEECLTQIEAIKPDLILLDVSMPGIDGYQTCRTLKAKESTRHIPIVFVSARSTLEDKIKGDEAGGQDYITKPFNHSELEVKIKQLIKSANLSMADVKQVSLINQELPSISALFLNDANTIINFFDACLNCHSFNELGTILLNTCEQLQLNCVIQFRSTDERYNFSTNKGVSPLELSLIEELILEKSHFFEFNSHMIFTHQHLSLLVKNLPKDDGKYYSDLKIMLGTLLSGVEAKLKLLFNEANFS